MKLVYPVPVILSKGDKYLLASIPDCKIDTQGKNIVDAIEMARDAISLWCWCELDSGRELPIPSDISTIQAEEGDILTLVDVDIEAYRRKHETRTVRKNLTIPHWLNEKAEKQRVNFSKILKDALIQHLGIGIDER